MMKKQLIFKGAFIAIAVVGLTLNSCKKDKDVDSDQDSSIAENYALAEKTTDDLDAISDEAEAGNKLSTFKTSAESVFLSDTIKITKTSSNDTTYVTVDFGEGVTCKDDKVRSGKINIVRIGTPLTAGSKRTLTTDNYYVNYNKVEATRMVEYMGLNSSNNPYWSISASHVITISSTNGTIEGSSNRIREWSAGSSTLLNRLDDEFTISGTASGTKANGIAFTAEITSSLVRSIVCQQFTKGILTITPAGKKARVIDYGNGDCDGTATVTVGEYSKTISVKK